MRVTRRIRAYQRPFHEAWVTGKSKRLIEIAHRRWGKDEIALMATCELAHRRVGSYWHCLPEYEQGRKALWTAVNPHTGQRRIDEAFPPEIRESKDEQAMFVKLKCGSTWQLVGSDRYNSLVGAGVAGVVFSEWALANPSAWGYIRPMIEENNGWAAFITTPRGRNHAKSMYDMARDNPRWFAEISTAKDTGALTDQQLEDSLAEYVSLYGEDIGRAQFEQEYLCSFNAAIMGAFYAREMLAVRNEGRISEIEPAPGVPVHTAWDLGVRDSTAIWWFQVVGAQVFILDFYMSHGAGVDHYAEICASKPWRKGTDFVPHDAAQREWGSGRSRLEQMQRCGLKPQILPVARKLDGVAAVRKTLPLTVFHPRCDEGIDALEQYRREWDDDRKTFRDNEVHDWCFTGDTKVLTRYGTHPISELPATGQVLTQCGWKPYTNPRITRRAAPLVEVRFKDGLTVRCTPDHMFMTASGWRYAKDLTPGLPILSCLTPSRFISMAAFTAVGKVTAIGRAAARNCIGTFGRLRSALFPKVAISTIGTETPTTTASPTWNVCPQVLTFHTLGLSQGATEGQASTFRITRDGKLLSGTSLTKGGFGTNAMPSGLKAGPSGSVKPSLVLRAGQSLRHWCAKAATVKSIAAKFAKWRHIEGVETLNETADVWCITVPDQESFALSNGAVVHNCSHAADAFRYLAHAWRIAPREEAAKPKAIPPGHVLLPGPPEPSSGRRIRV